MADGSSLEERKGERAEGHETGTDMTDYNIWASHSSSEASLKPPLPALTDIQLYIVAEIMVQTFTFEIQKVLGVME